MGNSGAQNAPINFTQPSPPAGVVPEPVHPPQQPLYVHIETSTKWRDPLTLVTLGLAIITIFLVFATALLVVQTHRDAKEAVVTAQRINAQIIDAQRATNQQSIDAQRAINEKIITTQRETAKDSIRATVGQGERTILANASWAWLEQRPWLSVDHWEMNADMKEGNDIMVVLFLKNTGKTPAILQTADTNFFLLPEEPSVEEMNAPSSDVAKNTVTIVAGDNGSRITRAWKNIDAALVADYKAGKRRLYIHSVFH